VVSNNKEDSRVADNNFTSDLDKKKNKKIYYYKSFSLIIILIIKYHELIDC